MTGPIRIVIEGPPVGKQRAQITRNGAYTPSKSRAFERLVAMRAAVAMTGLNPIAGPCRAKIEAVIPIPKSWSRSKQTRARDGLIWPTSRPDLDNYIKSAFDAMNGIVYLDDAQICRIAETEKRYGFEPKLIIEISEIR